MKTRMTAAAIAVLVNGAAVADEIDQSAITEFQAGQPALAAEVNANFDALISSIDDNDSRLDALEVAVSMPANSQQITVDCDADAAALADAVANGSLSVGLDITASGTCDAVLIDRDHVSITGPAIIVSNAAGDDSVAVNGATNVFLNDLTIDGAGAEAALSIRYNSSVVATGIVAQGADDTTVWIQFSSTLRLDGTNSISSAERIALDVTGNSLALATGTTTLTSNDRPLILAAGGLAAGGFDINGGEILVEVNSALFVDGTINVNRLTVDRNSSLNVESDGDDITINAGINVFSNSSLLFDTRDGGTVTHTGNISGSAGLIAALGTIDNGINTISISSPTSTVALTNQSYFLNSNATVLSDAIAIRVNSAVTFTDNATFGGSNVSLAFGASFFGFANTAINESVFNCEPFGVLLGPVYAYNGGAEYCNP